MNLVAEAEQKFKVGVTKLQSSLSMLPSGRITPEMLDTIQVVTSHGARLPVKGVASIAVMDQLTLKVTPFDRGDKSMLGALLEGVLKSSIGLNAYVEGSDVLVKLSECSEERKNELRRAVKKEGDACKEVVRNIRHEYMKQIQRDCASKDEQKRLGDGIDKLVKDYGKKIDELVAAKIVVFG